MDRESTTGRGVDGTAAFGSAERNKECEDEN